MEVFSSVLFEPVDPKEIGSTQRAENTRERVRRQERLDAGDVVRVHLENAREVDRALLYIPISYWRHNGSIMGLHGGEESYEITYIKPKSKIAALGVDHYRNLFKGVSTDLSRFVGVAYTISGRCESVPYEVSGEMSDDGSRLVLAGEAPVLGAECEVTGSRPAELVFEFLGTPDDVSLRELKPNE